MESGRQKTEENTIYRLLSLQTISPVSRHMRNSGGEFSTSARVSAFLTTVSHYQVSLRHLSGSANLLSDFTCHNAPDCDNPNCPICSFVAQIEDSTVNAISVQDVLSGSAKLPFTTCSTWLATQSECADLHRVYAHLIIIKQTILHST